MGVSSDQTVRDVIIRYPATGPIFLQYGPTFISRPGEPHLRYEALTLEQYAALNQIALEPLLRRLNAAAEDQPPPSGKNPSWSGPVIGGTLGYTGAYCDPAADLELVSVVEVQTARGPD